MERKAGEEGENRKGCIIPVMGTGSQCPRMAAGKSSGACIILPCPAHTGASKGKEFLGFLNLYSISVYDIKCCASLRKVTVSSPCLQTLSSGKRWASATKQQEQKVHQTGQGVEK